MDTSKLSQGQMVAAGGGVVLIVSLFLHWAGGQSAWDGFSVVHILMLLVGIAALAWAVLPATGAQVSLPPAAPMIVGSFALAVFGFAAGWEFEISGDVGVWLAILGSLAIAFGAFEGGRLPAAGPSAAPGPPPPSAPAV